MARKNTNAQSAKKPTAKGSKPTKASSQRSSSERITTEKKTETTTSTEKRFVFKPVYVIPVIVILALLGLIYFSRSFFIAATVNGQPITRLAVIREMEKQHGKTTLANMVTKTLIMQEAKKRNISVTDQEVNDEVAKVEKNLKSQGQDLNKLLTAQGMTRADLIDQIKVQKLVEKMFAKDIVVSDAEVNQYIEQNQSSLSANTDPNQLKTDVRTQLSQQKLQQKFTQLMTQLNKDSKIKYYVQY